MPEYAKVFAATLSPDYVDITGTITGTIGDTYNPNNVGERGFMELADAVAAETAGDVYIGVHESERSLEMKLNGPPKIRLPQGQGQAPAQPPQQPPAAITATVTGTGTPTAEIDVGGGPAAAAGTVTLTANAGADIDGLTVVAFAQNDSANDVAVAIAAMLDGKQDTGGTVTLSAQVQGNVVEVTEAGGGNIVSLTAVVA